MKISKERLKQILKEELQLANEQEQPADKERDMKTKSHFSKKLYELSKQVKDLQGLDAIEMKQIMDITITLLELSNKNSAGPIIKQISAIISKRIGDKK